MAAQLPLFYKELKAFEKGIHGKYSFPETAPDYSFAAQTNIIPLLINESGLASRHYPLVFLPPPNGAEQPVLAAMVGIGDGVNRYVDDQGRWRADTYIPAWVRRYPFLLVKNQDNDDSVLALDTQVGWLEESGGETFVDEKAQPTARLERIIAFQQEFQRVAVRTEAIVRAINEAGLLEEGNIHLNLTDDNGQPQQIPDVKGFMVVNETRVHELSDEKILQLHKADAFGLIYIHLNSLHSFDNVLRVPEL